MGFYSTIKISQKLVQYRKMVKWQSPELASIAFKNTTTLSTITPMYKITIRYNLNSPYQPNGYGAQLKVELPVSDEPDEILARKCSPSFGYWPNNTNRCLAI